MLNADDPLVAEMAEDCTGQVIFFGMDRAGPRPRPPSRRRRQGGLPAQRRPGAGRRLPRNVLLRGSRHPRHLRRADPLPGAERAGRSRRLLGRGRCPWTSIRLGLRTFQTDEKTAPGRFNMFPLGQAQVIVDYGHNPHALRAIQAAMRRDEAPRARSA